MTTQTDRIEKQIVLKPYRQFAWRWHPHAIDSNKDYSHEPTTLVLFELGIPAERRATAFRGNFRGLVDPDGQH